MTLIEQFQAVLDNGVSQTQAAKSMGVSGSVISDWKQGKYKGKSDRIESLIADFISRHNAVTELKQSYKDDFDFVETSVFDKIIIGAELAEVRGEIRTVCGDSGVGKTTALMEIKRRKPTSIFVEVYRGIRKNRFLKKVCNALGIDDRGSFDDLFERIADHLKNTKRLIMIDEAEHLPLDAIDALRRFVDFTGCGLLLVGLPIFYNRLREFQKQYGYIYNRTSMPILLDHLKASDTEKLINTLVESNIPHAIWHAAAKGIGRDLKIIALESLRVAQLNNVSTSDVAAMTSIIRDVTKQLGRCVA